jgi:chorismate-pyruvate lyase
MRLLAVGAISALLLSETSAAGNDPASAQAWGASVTSRLEALALLSTLNADLLSHESATLTLEHWCETHQLASPAKVTAERITSIDKPPSAEQRQELGVGPTEVIRYRRVRLTCGQVLLSEADNWYVPSRLSPEMNKALDGTDTPFGKVVLPTHFQRHTLSSRLLWSPLPVGWEMGASRGLGVTSVPESVLEHKALLRLPDGTPISEVVETYKSGVLAFPVPQLEAESTKSGQ